MPCRLRSRFSIPNPGPITLDSRRICHGTRSLQRVPMTLHCEPGSANARVTNIYRCHHDMLASCAQRRPHASLADSALDSPLLAACHAGICGISACAQSDAELDTLARRTRELVMPMRGVCFGAIGDKNNSPVDPQVPRTGREQVSPWMTGQVPRKSLFARRSHGALPSLPGLHSIGSFPGRS